MQTLQPVAPPAAVSPLAAVFAQQRYVVVPGMIAPHEAAALSEHMDGLDRDGQLIRTDEQVPQTPCTYGAIEMERLLGRLGPKMEFLTGLRLFPTYSFARIYKHGDVLKVHRDRAACEVSMSLNLGQEPEDPWPLWLRTHEGQDVPVLLRPGDALVYRGIELAHWREAYPGQRLAQVFLHYVDRNGPHAGQIFDRRAGLGQPLVTG